MSPDFVVTAAVSAIGDAANGGSLVCTRGPLTAADIFGRSCPLTPWPASSRPLLAHVVALLPALDHDRTADLLEQLAFALIERDEALEATRALLSVALNAAHAQAAENSRLQKRLVDLLNERRRTRPDVRARDRESLDALNAAVDAPMPRSTLHADMSPEGAEGR